MKSLTIWTKWVGDKKFIQILTILSFAGKENLAVSSIIDDVKNWFYWVQKRLAFHVFREENSIDKNPNCLELIGRLGRSANDAVATINECAIQLSETVEEYLDDFDETVAAKLKRLNASKIAAQKCLDSDNNDLIKSCIRDVSIVQALSPPTVTSDRWKLISLIHSEFNVTYKKFDVILSFYFD